MKGELFLLVASAALAQQYTIFTFAGGAPPPTPIAAVQASIRPLGGIAADDSGNLYFSSNACVFKVDASGVLTRVAGNSRPGHSGDGGLATSAEIGGAGQVAVDHAGNLYVTDSASFNSGAIRKISLDGTIRSVVTGLDLLPESPSFPRRPLAVDQNDNLYFIDGARIRKLSADGSVTTVAGNGSELYSGTGGPAVNAAIGSPQSIAFDAIGNLYIAGAVFLDEFTGYGRISIVTPDGMINVFAGQQTGDLGNDGPAITAVLQGNLPAISVDRAGEVFFLEFPFVRKIGPDGVVTTVHASDQIACPGSNKLCAFDVSADPSGRLYLIWNSQPALLIQRFELNGRLTTVAGGGPGIIGDGGPAVNAPLSSPAGIAVDAAHNVYIGDSSNRIRRVTPDGTITTVAGNGNFRVPGAPSGDGGTALSAQLACVPTYASISGCKAIAADALGNFYFSDGDRVRKVSADGTITTAANVKAHGLASDGQNVLLADPYGAQILKLAPDGSLSTIAGNGSNGRSGDGGQATKAQLFIPVDVALDGGGNIYIAEMYDSRIRKVTPDGIIGTIAGGGRLGDGPALDTLLAPNLGIAADRDGNVYIAEYDTNRIRKISGGAITTIAGTCGGDGLCFGYSGDGGPATAALINGPVRLAVDSNGNVYIAARDNDAIRVLRPVR